MYLFVVFRGAVARHRVHVLFSLRTMRRQQIVSLIAQFFPDKVNGERLLWLGVGERRICIGSTARQPFFTSYLLRVFFHFYYLVRTERVAKGKTLKRMHAKIRFRWNSYSDRKGKALSIGASWFVMINDAFSNSCIRSTEGLCVRVSFSYFFRFGYSIGGTIDIDNGGDGRRCRIRCCLVRKIKSGSLILKATYSHFSSVMRTVFLLTMLGCARRCCYCHSSFAVYFPTEMFVVLTDSQC